MAHEMEFREVEVAANSEVNEDVFIRMEATKSIIESVQRCRTMEWVLRKIDKIEKSPDGSDKAHRRHSAGKTHVDNESK